MYYLQKRIGLSYREIFGGVSYEQQVVEVSRSGVVGRLKDVVFGKRTRVESFKTREDGLSAEAFAAYLELMRKESERKKKNMQKNRAKRSLSGV